MKTGTMLLAMVMVFLFTTATVSMNRSVESPAERGADLIVIDTMRTMKPLERPPVVFFHSRHTDALATLKGDCTACHMTEANGRLSLKFKRLADTDAKTVSDTYHLNCIACHRDMATPDGKSGPLTCGGCHREEPTAVSTRQPITFDKSLHYRHVKANQEKCDACHHTYNKQTQALTYAKGQEGACSYCHKETPVGDTSGIKDASHRQCISCHRDRITKKQSAGPVTCVGCHDADHQLGIEVLADVPRLKRGQPDVLMVATGPPPEEGKRPPPTMNPVPFDHLAHETANASCKVCHHADIKSCSSCHTHTGGSEGDGIRLAQAMHSPTDPASCIGCHQQKQQAPECAGCHALMATPDRPDETSCAACHMSPLERPAASAGDGPAETAGTVSDVTAAETAMQMAQTLLASRDLKTKTVAADQIPQTVIIGDLSARFEPATFPHGKVVQALIDKTRNSRLAGYFHSDPATLCQGCHHNSPPAQKPPVCGSCHARTAQHADAFRPGLAGAYHQQCIGCHEAMGIAKPDARDCNACHVEKKNG